MSQALILVVLALVGGCGRDPEVIPAPPIDPPVAVGPEMLTVLGGEFLGNGSECDDSGKVARERGKRVAPVKLHVASYRIDRRVATCDEIRACVDSGRCVEDTRTDIRPFTCFRENAFVSFEIARKYCAARGALVPSRAQWQRAARGTDGREFPGGSEPPTDCEATMEFEEAPACLRVSPVGMEYRTRGLDEWTRDYDCTFEPNVKLPAMMQLSSDRISDSLALHDHALVRCVRER